MIYLYTPPKKKDTQLEITIGCLALLSLSKFSSGRPVHYSYRSIQQRLLFPE